MCVTSAPQFMMFSQHVYKCTVLFSLNCDFQLHINKGSMWRGVEGPVLSCRSETS